MQKIKNITNSLHITWAPTYNCNFSCKYCKPEFHQKDAPVSSLEELKTIYYKISQFINSDKTTVIWFTGGEPSRVPALTDFCKFLKTQNKPIKIGINSNGSASFDYYNELLKYVHEIAFSVHFDFIKYKAYFKKLIKLVPKYKNRIHFCIMYDTKYREQVLRSITLLKKYNIRFNLLRISGSGINTWNSYNKEDQILMSKDSSNDPYNTMLIDDEKYYSDHEFKNILNNDYQRFKNWKCSVSSEHLFIKYNTLYAGQCEILNYGNLLTQEIIPQKQVICDGRACSCTADLRVTKHI